MKYNKKIHENKRKRLQMRHGTLKKIYTTNLTFIFQFYFIF